MQNPELESVLALLERGCGARISVCDLGGLAALCSGLTLAHRIHAAPFCDLAKSTAHGLERCMRCKSVANRRAAAGAPFAGTCAFGLWEAACPVIAGDTLLGVVYAGNLRPGTCRVRPGAWHDAMRAIWAALPPAEVYGSAAADAAATVAELLAHRAASQPRVHVPAPPMHPAVRLLLQYANHGYAQPLTLARLARLVHMDAKYLGRLFRAQVGESFSAYLNRIRLAHARELLMRSGGTVLEIAMACGFANVSYFNRLYRAAYGTCPGDDRGRRGTGEWRFDEAIINNH